MALDLDSAPTLALDLGSDLDLALDSAPTLTLDLAVALDHL